MGGTLANYIFTVRVWHVLNGLAWSMDDTQVRAALTGAAILAPPASRQPKRVPITVGLMEHIFNKLNFSDLLDAAVTVIVSLAHIQVR